MVPRWSERVVLFLALVDELEDEDLIQDLAKFISNFSHFQLVGGQIYYRLDDGLLCLVAMPKDYPKFLMQSHVSNA